MIYRIVMDPRHPAGLAEISDRWDVGDLVTAHAYLDALDDLDALREERK